MCESVKGHQFKYRLPQYAAVFCALILHVCLPLVFRNALFDINRVKVDLVIVTMPACAAVCALGFFLCRSLPRFGCEVKRLCLPPFVFGAAAVISSCRCGLDSAVLLGTEGRQCGLFFLLACMLGFMVVVSGGMKGDRIRALGSLVAAAVAVLGMLNAVGIDPLGFYTRMQKGQEHLFLSTIGNIDFFGCYLALMLPVAASGWIDGEDGRVCCFYLLVSLCIAGGIAASRSDTALLAVQAGMLALLVFSGGSYFSMAKTLILWSASFAAYPAMYPLLLNANFFVPLSGVFLAICETGAAWMLSGVFAALAAYCLYAHKAKKKAIGQRRLMLAACLLLALAFALLFASSVYYTVYAPEAELGGAASLLRFDDHWGTRRGFVYRRSLRAFADYSLLDRLFGKGVDCTRRILEPYFDDPAMLAHGIFNDAHCQPLQYLLTTGLLGGGALMVFHVLLVFALFRLSKHDRVLCAYGAALCAYIPIALLSVSQPILIASYFAVSASAVSRIQYLTRGRDVRES